MEAAFTARFEHAGATILLALSALWVAWRHGFSGEGLLLGLTAFFGGALFPTGYVFVVSMVAKGDVQ